MVFRFIVFRPEIGSFLTAKIKNCTREGVFVTLGFFDDIFIPKDELQHPSRFEQSEQAWVWEYPVSEGKHDLYMDVGETIKIRVIDEEFIESEPNGAPLVSQTTTSTSTGPSTENLKPPYRIIVRNFKTNIYYYNRIIHFSREQSMNLDWEFFHGGAKIMLLQKMKNQLTMKMNNFSISHENILIKWIIKYIF